MSEYNIDKNTNRFEETTSFVEEKPKYLIAILAGLGASIVVSIILAVIGIWLETEYMLVLAFGIAVVAGIIHIFVPENSFVGALIGAILCPTTYFLYQLIMAIFGYYYEDGSTFWVMLVVSIILGAWLGYNND